MPKLLKTPFAADAAEGYRTDIQESTGAAPNSATYQTGFPPNTMQSIAAGGVPPKGSDLNGVLYDITDNLVFLTQGGGYGFDAAYATSIGGYPLNAMLHLANGDIVKSTIDGNTNDPNIDMTGWFVPYMRGSQNLAELTDVAQARTKLDVYSKSEALAKDNNLSELTDKAVARTNLDVYSKSETDSIAGTPNATEAIAGKAKIATTAIAQAGVNDTDFITALKLKQSFTSQHSNTGWEKLPDGLIIQWGLAATGATTPFPIAFPTACYQVAVSYSSSSGNGVTFASQSITATRTGVSMYNVGGVPSSYIAIGK